jgi:hypothetical protein
VFDALEWMIRVSNSFLDCVDVSQLNRLWKRKKEDGRRRTRIAFRPAVP